MAAQLRNSKARAHRSKGPKSVNRSIRVMQPFCGAVGRTASRNEVGEHDFVRDGSALSFTVIVAAQKAGKRLAKRPNW
jgi:hypothetical protein